MRHTTKPVISSGGGAALDPRSPLLRTCPRCGAGPRQSCRRTIGVGDGAYTRRLLKTHVERSKPRSAA